MSLQEERQGDTEIDTVIDIMIAEVVEEEGVMKGKFELYIYKIK